MNQPLTSVKHSAHTRNQLNEARGMPNGAVRVQHQKQKSPEANEQPLSERRTTQIREVLRNPIDSSSRPQKHYPLHSSPNLPLQHSHSSERLSGRRSRHDRISEEEDNIEESINESSSLKNVSMELNPLSPNGSLYLAGNWSSVSPQKYRSNFNHGMDSAPHEQFIVETEQDIDEDIPTDIEQQIVSNHRHRHRQAYADDGLTLDSWR
jgi:hypothetical protein